MTETMINKRRLPPDRRMVMSLPMWGLSPSARRWSRRTAVGIIASIVPCTLAMTSAAHGQAQADPTLSSLEWAGEITLGGDDGSIDWVKWGYPITDANDGPFNAQDFEAGRATLRQTRKQNGTAIGALSTVVPAQGSTAEKFWSYERTSGTRFLWTGGDPLASPPPGVVVNGGIAILSAGVPLGHDGWGFQFSAAATDSLRLLDIFVDCPPNPDPTGEPPTTDAIVEVALGNVQRRSVAVCRDSTKRVQKVTVSFSTAIGVATGSLSVTLTMEDQPGVTRPIVLLAATLRPYDAGAGGAGGGAGGASGTGGASAGSGGRNGAASPALADRPTACAIGGGAAAGRATGLGTDAGATALLILLVLRRRRLSGAR